MKKILPVLFFIIPILVFSQTERYPMFKECKNVVVKEQKVCFYQQTKNYFFKEFKVPKIIEKENFKKTVNVLFIVDAEGGFKTLLCKFSL